MKVEKMQPYGYCSGVLRAISLAHKAKEEHPNEKVYVLGMLVHNQEVIDELSKKGIISVPSLDDLQDGSVVVLSAHGHSKSTYQICDDKHLQLYDATCPKVQHNIDLIKKTQKPIIYIGIKKHDEALAALSYSNNVLFYDMNDEFGFKPCNDEIIVINQTTINSSSLKGIYAKIKSFYPNARIENEVCNATRLRQQAIIEASNDIDCFVIVGDKASSNTNRLFEIAKTTHPDSCVIMVSNVSEIDCNALKNKKCILVAGGASTPPSTIDAIFDYLNNISE